MVLLLLWENSIVFLLLSDMFLTSITRSSKRIKDVLGGPPSCHFVARTPMHAMMKINANFRSQNSEFQGSPGSTERCSQRKT
jgi:hypothetical protein